MSAWTEGWRAELAAERAEVEQRKAEAEAALPAAIEAHRAAHAEFLRHHAALREALGEAPTEPFLATRLGWAQREANAQAGPTPNSFRIVIAEADRRLADLAAAERQIAAMEAALAPVQAEVEA
jgi:hypothetical protein